MILNTSVLSIKSSSLNVLCTMFALLNCKRKLHLCNREFMNICICICAYSSHKFIFIFIIHMVFIIIPHDVKPRTELIMFNTPKFPSFNLYLPFHSTMYIQSSSSFNIYSTIFLFIQSQHILFPQDVMKLAITMLPEVVSRTGMMESIVTCV